MSLVRWFRKNNKKVMAVVVIVLMVGFIGGSYLQYLGRRRGGQHETVAYFGKKQKITNYDLAMADRELELLRMLRADVLLRTQDFRMLLLGELLFSEQRSSPELINQIRREIISKNYSVSNKQINDIYMRSLPNHFYWHLLKNEAEQAGIKLSKESVGDLLARIIPKLTEGVTYSQLIGSLVNNRGIPEEQILTTFGNLLAVAEYARVICTNEDLTGNQISYVVGIDEQMLNIEFVRFDASIFADSVAEPKPEQIAEQFKRYKGYRRGQVDEQNPFGFGYTLPDMVRLEYIAIDLDDVSQIISSPTDQEKEQYYQRNIQDFVMTTLSDPNDPNSPTIERTRTYAEVVATIERVLRQRKINAKATSIIQQAKTITETGLQEAATEVGELSDERFKEMSVDYKAAAEQLSNEHNITVYSGTTGLLSAADVQSDEDLGMLYQRGPGYNPTALTQIVFAVEPLNISELGPFDAPKPRLYENIGPLRDIFGNKMVLVRIIETQEAAEPESIDLVLSKEGVRFGQDVEDEVYSVNEEVAEDLKNLAAMEVAKDKAEKFIEVAEKEGWDSAVEEFNRHYGKSDEDPNVPETFVLQKLKELRRISKTALEMLAAQKAGDAVGEILANDTKLQETLVDKFFSLIPEDSNSVESLPMVLEFKPNMSYYCLKDISVRRIYKPQYESVKSQYAYQDVLIETESLMPVHFNPENIVKRMNFRPARQRGQEQAPKAQAAEPNTPADVEQNQ